MTNIYVLNADGTPLMPCHNAGRVRRMLKKGKAVIKCYKPFTIQLVKQIESPVVQDCTIGIDPGRTNIGVAVVDGKGRGLFSSNVQTDNKAVKRHMSDRKMHRQASRRGERLRRKHRARKNGTTTDFPEGRMLPGYKKPVMVKDIINTESKFNNRVRPKGWLTPSAVNLLRTHINVIKKVQKFLPVSRIAVEINRFDFARMENPGIKNWQYQKGRLFGFKDRDDAVYHLQKGKCLLCGRKDIDQYHHIVPRSQGGSDSIDNIAGLCNSCHDAVHKNEKKREALLKKKQGLMKKYHALSLINTIMPYLLKAYADMKPTYVTTGCETRATRIKYDLPEKQKDDGTHYIDAWCIAVSACKLDPAEADISGLYNIRQFRRHDRVLIHSQRERTYYLDGKAVCKNRHKRTGQSDAKDSFPSLAEYRNMYPENVSRLTVRKSERRYNNMSRMMPGAAVICGGNRRVVSGNMGNRFTLVTQGGVREAASTSKCRVITQNGGLVFI